MFNRQDSKYDQVKKDARRLGDSISELVGESKDQGKEKLSEITDTAKEKLQDAKHYAQEKGQKIDKMAHEHVWMTAAMAAVAGVVAGMIISIMFRRK